MRSPPGKTEKTRGTCYSTNKNNKPIALAITYHGLKIYVNAHFSYEMFDGYQVDPIQIQVNFLYKKLASVAAKYASYPHAGFWKNENPPVT